MKRRPGLMLRRLARTLTLGGSLRPYLAPHRKALIGTGFISLLGALLRLLEPWPLQIAFDYAILGRPVVAPLTGVHAGAIAQLLSGQSREALLLGSGVALVGISVVIGALAYLQSLTLARTGLAVMQELRIDLFHQMQRLSLPFHRRTPGGDLLLRLTGDLNLVRETLTATLVSAVSQLALLIAVLVVMALLSWKLALVSVVLAPALTLFFRSFRGRMTETARKQRKREGRLAGSIEEVLLAIPMIQAYSAEAREDERFRSLAKRSQRAGLRAAKLEAGFTRIVELLLAVGMAVVLWFGAREVIDGALTPGVFLVFLAYLRMLYKPVRGLAKVAQRSARASAAMERVLEVLRAPREIKSSKGAVTAPRFSGALEFAEVSFSHPDGTEVLSHLDLSIAAGEQVAILGSSGAGKSTILSLVPRFLSPTTGKVKIDGRSIKEFTLPSLRRQIVFLTQEPYILGTTVRDNLLYGRPDATDDELWAALAASELESRVREMPGGLDTPLASRGESLSGGERQRLAIARALLRDAPIVLLDEPTTGLDAPTAAAVVRSLARLREGRTTLVVAHDPSALGRVDRTFEFVDGRLVERDRSAAIGLSEESGLGSDAPLIPGLLPDPAVKGIARLLAPGGPARLSRELEALGLPSGLRFIYRKQRVGQRALLVAEAGAARWYVKLTRSAANETRLNCAQEVHAQAARIGVHAPRPLGWISRFRASLWEEVPGDPLLETRDSDVWRALGRSLARLHDTLSLPARTVTRHDELDRVQLVRQHLVSHRGELISRFDAEVEEWRDALTAIPDPARHVAIHGDLHPGQIMWTRDRIDTEVSIGLIDWDEHASGEPERDLGNLLAHLDLEWVRGTLDAREATVLANAFLDGYRDARACDEALVAWYRWGARLRLSALHSWPGFGRQPPNPPGLCDRLIRGVAKRGSEISYDRAVL